MCLQVFRPLYPKNAPRYETPPASTTHSPHPHHHTVAPECSPSISQSCQMSVVCRFGRYAPTVEHQISCTDGSLTRAQQTVPVHPYRPLSNESARRVPSVEAVDTLPHHPSQTHHLSTESPIEQTPAFATPMQRDTHHWTALRWRVHPTVS